MATRSTRNFKMALPRSHVWRSESQQCATRIFGEGERPAERFAGTRETPLHRRVQRTDLGDGHQRLLLHTILTPTHAGCEPAFASFQRAHLGATEDARAE